jgi:hypothetical protein
LTSITTGERRVVDDGVCDVGDRPSAAGTVEHVS